MFQITKKNEKQAWAWIVIGVIIIFLLAALLSHIGKKHAENEAMMMQEAAQNNIQQTVPATTTQAPAATAPAQGSAAMHKAPSSSAAYTAALAMYAKTRFQLDDSCQALPKSMVLVNGTKIMIDNRSPFSRNVSVGESTYTVEPYGWQIVYLSSKSLPATITMNCDTDINVAQVLLQK